MNIENKVPNSPLPKSPQERRPRTPSTATAAQKAEAVLKVWAERSSPSRICREMNITWTILNHWQKRAMEGMLQALEPHVQLDKGPALSPRLQALLKKQASLPLEKLQRTLNRLEQKKFMGG
jgi:transposase-like protein